MFPDFEMAAAAAAAPVEATADEPASFSRRFFVEEIGWLGSAAASWATRES